LLVQSVDSSGNWIFDGPSFFNEKKTIRSQNQDLLAFVSVAVEDDHCPKNMQLSKVNVASIDTIFTTVHKDLGLTQKSE
jgi:hypothetical protein